MKLRPRAEVFCFKNGKVLCHWAKGYTVFPGGGIDVNESAMQAAKREAMEEADRVVLNCMAAHEPTVQVWAEGYSKINKWAKGHTGGLTYWMVGTTTEKPFTPEVNAKERHKDYEADFAWREISDVLKQLKTETSGDWSDDVAVRIGILENQSKLEEPLKSAQPLRLPVTATQASVLYHGSPTPGLSTIKANQAKGLNPFQSQHAVYSTDDKTTAALYAIGKSLKGKTPFAVTPSQLLVVGDHVVSPGTVYTVPRNGATPGAAHEDRGTWAHPTDVQTLGAESVDPEHYKKHIQRFGTREDLNAYLHSLTPKAPGAPELPATSMQVG